MTTVLGGHAPLCERYSASRSVVPGRQLTKRQLSMLRSLAQEGALLFPPRTGIFKLSPVSSLYPAFVAVPGDPGSIRHVDRTTCNNLLLSGLLEEVPRPPGTDWAQKRYALSTEGKRVLEEISGGKERS